MPLTLLARLCWRSPFTTLRILGSGGMSATAARIAEAKVELDFLLMCLAVWIGVSARSVESKVIAIVSPLALRGARLRTLCREPLPPSPREASGTDESPGRVDGAARSKECARIAPSWAR